MVISVPEKEIRGPSHSSYPKVVVPSNVTVVPSERSVMSRVVPAGTAIPLRTILVQLFFPEIASDALVKVQPLEADPVETSPALAPPVLFELVLELAVVDGTAALRELVMFEDLMTDGVNAAELEAGSTELLPERPPLAVVGTPEGPEHPVGKPVPVGNPGKPPCLKPGGAIPDPEGKLADGKLNGKSSQCP